MQCHSERQEGGCRMGLLSADMYVAHVCTLKLQLHWCCAGLTSSGRAVHQRKPTLPCLRCLEHISQDVAEALPLQFDAYAKRNASSCSLTARFTRSLSIVQKQAVLG